MFFKEGCGKPQRAGKGQKKRIQALERYLKNNWEGIVRLPEAWRLGAIEGQVFHHLAPPDKAATYRIANWVVNWNRDASVSPVPVPGLFYFQERRLPSRLRRGPS